MPNLFVVVDGRRQSLQTEASPLGRGGEADIFRSLNFAGSVAKVYHTRNGAQPTPRAKLEAMLARPPEHLVTRVAGADLPLFAWPTHIVEEANGQCAGFLMREVPLDRAVTLSKYTSRLLMERALSLDDRSLPRRVQVCRNLAAAIAEMHRQQHYFVDIKPQNIYMFKDTGVVCLVDNDSFSIAPANGGPRFPASAFSAEYLAPELLRNGMAASSVVNDTQDRFALAVLVFQILNNGLHPFQGSPNIQTDEWNIDLCVKQGYYPHGLVPHPAVKPSPASVHDCWDTATRMLFDRAFTGAPSQRPSAEEWRNHLDQLGGGGKGVFTRCTVRPQDVLHLHFTGLACPECRLDGINAASPPPPVRSSPPPLNSRPPAPGPSAPSAPPAPASNKKWMLWLVAAVAATIGLITLDHRTKTAALAEVPAPAPAPAPVPAPPPVAMPAPRPAPPVADAAAAAAAAATAAAEPSAGEEAQTARRFSDPNDTPGINARISVIDQAVPDAVNENVNDVSAIITAGLAGDDQKTYELATTGIRGSGFLRHYEGWQRFRDAARPINEAVRLSYRSDVKGAVLRQSRAIALDPWDREIAGNLGLYLALDNNFQAAQNVAIYSLALPRPSTDTGRSADWQLLGSMLARQGKVREAQGAFFVGLAITAKLSGFCNSLLAQQAFFGEALKPPIEAVFRRIAERGQSGTEGCAYPPAWRN